MHHRFLRPFAVAFLTVAALLATAPLRPAHAQVPVAEFAARRAKLLDNLGDGIVLALGGREPSVDYQSFYQASDFRYLTGFLEPDAVLLMVRRGGTRTATVFVQPRDPAQEVWSGFRVGPAATEAGYGIPGRVRTDLNRVLDSVVASGLPLHIIGDLSSGRGVKTADDQFLDAFKASHPNVRVAPATEAVARLRAYKSPAEQELLRRAVDITVVAHLDAMRATAPGMAEFELQALVEYQFRRHGAERPGYASIVGSGPNSTTLHYNANNRVMRDGDVVVMDVGALYDGYSADITRSFPVSGKWTPAQRDIYEVVLAAQLAAERQVGPSRPTRAMNDSASAALAAGLARLGLIESAAATYDCSAEGSRQCRQLQLFYMHGLGHGIGLDVHDPDQYQLTGAMGAGSIFTIEPGIYVRANTLEIIPDTPRNRELKARIGAAVAKYANVGIRIEDDYLVTTTGYEHLSRGLPRDADAIERLMAEPFTGPAPRKER